MSMDLINYRRRDCREVVIGGKVRMGAGAPVVIQSMTSTSSMDTEASVAQIRRIAGAGAEIVRLTAQGTREAENIGRMRAMVDVPLVADIHFNPAAAMARRCRGRQGKDQPRKLLPPRSRHRGVAAAVARTVSGKRAQRCA